MKGDLIIRPMRANDLAGVHALQCRAHPDHYHEPQNALASRLLIGGAFCLVAEDEQRLLGYLFAHPWEGEPPPLHEALPPDLPVPADYLFMHDLAVCPQAQGAAVGRGLVDALACEAKRSGWVDLRLVAVGGARPYWTRHQFDVVPGTSLHPTYGKAVLMRRILVNEEVV